MARCATCGAAIEFATSAATGKTMPLDAEPVATGNIVLREGKAVVLKKTDPAPPADEPRFVSHYTTCKQAAAWRAGEKRRR